MIGWALAFGVVVVVTATVVYARYAQHPEQTAGHDHVPSDTTDDRFYRTADRPAGPDAEAGPGPLPGGGAVGERRGTDRG